MTRHIAIAIVFATLTALTGCANEVGSAEAEIVDDTIDLGEGTLSVTAFQHADDILDGAQPREWLIHLVWDDGGARPLTTEIDGPLYDSAGTLTPAGERLRSFLTSIDPEMLRTITELVNLPPTPGPVRPLSGSMLAVDFTAVLSASPVTLAVDASQLPACSGDDSFYDCISKGR